MSNKVSGLGDNFYIGGYDLSGDVASLDKISGGPALLDVTPINKSANVRIAGLRDGAMQFTTYFENSGAVSNPAVPASGTPYLSTYNWPVLVTISAGTVTNVTINGSTQGTGDGTYLLPALGAITLTYSVAPTWNWVAVGTEHNALSILPRADVHCMYARGTAINNPAACCLGIQLSYDITRDNKGALSAQVEVNSDGFGMEWGTLLTPGVRVDTTATNGSSRNDAASSAYGAQAYCQLLNIIGTSVDIVIQHSTDNATWSTLIDFGSLSAIGAARGSVSNTATVNQYLRVITSGTFTYAAFAVMINRNQIPGQVF
jgi:hypothetical protein